VSTRLPPHPPTLTQLVRLGGVNQRQHLLHLDPDLAGIHQPGDPGQVSTGRPEPELPEPYVPLTGQRPNPTAVRAVPTR
jgi:hypothetical protein